MPSNVYVLGEIAALTMPSVNFTPSITLGKWLWPSRRRRYPWGLFGFSSGIDPESEAVMRLSQGRFDGLGTVASGENEAQVRNEESPNFPSAATLPPDKRRRRRGGPLFTTGRLTYANLSPQSITRFVSNFRANPKLTQNFVDYYTPALIVGPRAEPAAANQEEGKVKRFKLALFTFVNVER